MSEVPEEAVTLAYAEYQRLYPQRTAPWGELAEWERERFRRVIAAAAPHLLAAGVSAHRAEQDAVHADLSQLLRVLGMGDHARPQSSHEVMLDAINEVGRIRTQLAELENAVSWNTSCTSCAAVLDSSIRDHSRAEAAEERTAGMAAALERAEAIIGERDAQLAHEHERGEALIVQAQDYASAESERADRLVILAREILAAVTPGDADDAPEFTRWQMVLDQLDGAAGEMSPPDSDPLEDAYQAGIKDERERIAAELNSRADGLDGMVPAGTGVSRADLQLMATTLRNTAWAIVSGDQAVNLQEATDG